MSTLRRTRRNGSNGLSRRDFLRYSGGGLLLALGGCNRQTPPPPVVPDVEPAVRLQNWARTFTFSNTSMHTPTTVAEVQELVRRRGTWKGTGTLHSFSNCADTAGGHISLSRLNQVLRLDAANRRVTVGAGIRYGELCQQLHREGLAVHNLASLPHISVGGACATGTHGSGDRLGNLSTAVVGLQIVNGRGEVVELSRDRDGDRFRGAVVNLGALGVVTALTLEIVPEFPMRQWVYEHMPLEELAANFDRIMSAAYSVSLFTDWRNQNINQVWLKHRVSDDPRFSPEPRWFGARLANVNRHPIVSLSADPCTPQLGVEGPSYERLPHFRMNFTPSSGEEMQAEFFVPRDRAVQAIRAIFEIHEQVSPVLQITEIRSISRDDLWLSESYGQNSIAIHFTLRKDAEGVNRLLPVIQRQLAPFGARPHWAKQFSLEPAAFRLLYPKLDDFRALVREFDPEGKFRNAFLDRYVLA